LSGVLPSAGGSLTGDVTSSGKLGLNGTSSIRSTLDLNNGIIAGVNNIRGHANNSQWSIWGGLGVNETSPDGGFVSVFGSTNTNLSGGLKIGGGGTNVAITVDNTGNVGVGVAPTAGIKMDVSGTSRFATSTFTTSVSSPALSGVFYGDGSKLTGVVLTSGGSTINGNLTVTGTLSATGTSTFFNTIVNTTSTFSISSVSPLSSVPALYVGQSGPSDIASFYDIDQNIEILHIGGNNSIYPNVGIKTSSPNKTLTVNGDISATGKYFGTYDSAGALTTVTGKTVSYTLALSDVNTVLTINNGIGTTVSIPTSAVVPFPVGTQILVQQAGTAQVTVAPVNSGTTIVQAPSNKTKTAVQYSVITLLKLAPEVWGLAGDLG
jgi:hypothetical protein